jgi:uncharacterized membrane protein HdeD (DUF308 family)
MANEPPTRQSSAPTWLFVVAGLVSIAAGVIVLAKPADSLVTLVIIAGIFILVDGAFDLVASFMRSTESRALTAVLSVISIVVGVLLIRHPLGGVLAAALLIGIWLAAAGVVRVIRALEGRQSKWGIVVGVLEVIAGIVLVSTPAISLATLALLVGISFIVNGIGQLTLGILLGRLKDADQQLAAATP